MNHNPLKMNMAKPGRPTTYNEHIAKEICDAIASSELGLMHLCNKNPHWPNRSTIFLWRRTHKEFAIMYDQAKEDQTEVVVEYMQELMDEPHKYIDDNGINKVDIQLLRLKVDAIKWQASKLKPKKFGEQRMIENLVQDNAKYKQELDILREQLYSQHKKEF